MKLRSIVLVLGIIFSHTAAIWRNDMRLSFMTNRLYYSTDMLVTIGKLIDETDERQQSKISMRQTMLDHAQLGDVYLSKINHCVEMNDDEIQALNCCIKADHEMNVADKNLTSFMIKSGIGKTDGDDV